MADAELRSIPINYLTSVDPALATNGSLLVLPGPAPFAYLKTEFQGQPGILPLVNVSDRPFTIIPIAPGLGPYLQINGAELVVDLSRTHTATSGEIRPGLAFVAGNDSGIVARFGYGTSYVRTDGVMFANADWSVTSFLEAWRFIINVNGQPYTVVDSRTGMRI